MIGKPGVSEVILAIVPANMLPREQWTTWTATVIQTQDYWEFVSKDPDRPNVMVMKTQDQPGWSVGVLDPALNGNTHVRCWLRVDSD
jgi:hypothetical protein